MEGVTFLALRCFSCQMFQVNQRTKSGKWKCRVCGEGQSIVKVWGQGGHAKDVRGLVMELNGAAGRGEDPTTIVRSASQSQQHGARGHREAAARTGDSSSGGRAQIGRERFIANRGRDAPLRLGRTERLLEAEASSVGSRTLSQGFVSAGATPGWITARPGSWDARTGETILSSGAREHMREERRGAAYLDNFSTEAATACGGSNTRDSSTPFGSGFEGTLPWPSKPATALGGSKGSRWGSFASDRGLNSLGKRQRPPENGQQMEEDPNFVTSLPDTPSAHRRAGSAPGRGRGRNFLGDSGQQGYPTEADASRTRWTTSVKDAVHPRDKHQKSKRRVLNGSADQPSPVDTWGERREARSQGVFGTARAEEVGVRGGQSRLPRNASSGGASAWESNDSSSRSKVLATTPEPHKGGVRAESRAANTSSRWNKFV